MLSGQISVHARHSTEPFYFLHVLLSFGHGYSIMIDLRDDVA
jgi:hypothetical protein